MTQNTDDHGLLNSFLSPKKILLPAQENKYMYLGIF